MLSKKLQSELLVGSLDVVTSMAFVSAIREVADAEQSDAFTFDAQGYETLASTIAEMAGGVDGDFAVAYREVAQRVQNHARNL
ncbi:MAG: hypothetical protein IT342_06420 [Candidatus Melainabacteria bacterium]|nr:hypothetical protein [Candidatus Melainabacteria bacterium]